MLIRKWNTTNFEELVSLIRDHQHLVSSNKSLNKVNKCLLNTTKGNTTQTTPKSNDKSTPAKTNSNNTNSSTYKPYSSYEYLPHQKGILREIGQETHTPERIAYSKQHSNNLQEQHSNNLQEHSIHTKAIHQEIFLQASFETTLETMPVSYTHLTLPTTPYV